MKRTILALVLAAGLTSFTSSSLFATNLVSSAISTGGETYFSDTIGYKFAVGSQSLSVTSLGFYKNSNFSLNQPPKVGIWTAGGSLLASLTIPLDSFNDGRYLWKNLTLPLTLSASTSYLIGAFSGGSYMLRDSMLSSDVSLLGTARNGNQYEYSAPTSVFANGDAVVGPNMQYTAIPNATPSPTPPTGGGDSIPEPSTYALFGIGALALVIAYRRKVA